MYVGTAEESPSSCLSFDMASKDTTLCALCGWVTQCSADLRSYAVATRTSISSLLLLLGRAQDEALGEGKAWS